MVTGRVDAWTGMHVNSQIVWHHSSCMQFCQGSRECSEQLRWHAQAGGISRTHAADVPHTACPVDQGALGMLLG